MKHGDTPEAALNRQGWKKLLLSLLALAGMLVVQVIGFLVVVALNLPGASLASTAVIEAFAAGGATLGMLVLGGVSWLRTSRADIADALRTSRAILVADVAILVMACGTLVAEGTGVASDWLANLAATALICLGIGISEELTYRGVYLNGILAVSGRTHRGTMWGVTLTSILFGLAHVDVSTDFAEPFLAAQALLKVAQTGLFSIVLCAIALRNRRLGGVSLVHGLSDFLLMMPSLVLAGEELVTEYVTTGDDGVATIVIYALTIALYLPIAIRELRRMHREQLTYRGVFMEGAVQDYRKAQAQAIAVTPGLADLVTDAPDATTGTLSDQVRPSSDGASDEQDRQGRPVPPSGFPR